MPAESYILSMNISARKEFLYSFVSEIVYNINKKHVAKLVKKEIESELLREVIRQRREMERMEESKPINRQFMPSIMHLAEQQQAVIQPEAKEDIEKKSLSTGTSIDGLLSQKEMKAIECSNGRVIIKKNGEFEQTNVMLNENEIREIIKKFSEETKIPLVDNILKTTLGDFEINAIVSEKIGSRFLIAKKDKQTASYR